MDSYERKVARSIRLLQSIPKDGPVDTKKFLEDYFGVEL